jgi:signal transduction histidine kinase
LREENPSVRQADGPTSRWHDSFYWRLGGTFMILVITVVIAQNLILTYTFESALRENPDRSPNNRSIAVATQVSQALAAGPIDDLSAFLQGRFEPQPAVYVVMTDGRVGGTTPEALPEEIHGAADIILRGQTTTGRREEPRSLFPMTFVPIQAYGELRGVAVLPPPAVGVGIRSVARFASPPGIVILLVATFAAAFVIFAPARRRLAMLEAAAVQMGGGDLFARAAENGRDEIARVAKAFNQMGSELAARDAALRASDRLRRQLLADVSHELKTPLTAMRGYVETLQLENSELDAERRARYLKTVARETYRLERIVNDLIDLGRYENSVGTLNVRIFAVERVFEHVIRRHEADADARRVAIRTYVDEGADQIAGDPDRIDQAVENLVANALRYVPDGGVIELHATAIANGVQIVVVDSGSGIEPAHLAHIFDRFYKVDPARAGAAAGSGLGLSIVKAIVERHGGTVEVSSRPGRTAFTMRLPQSASSPDPEPFQ